MPVHSCNLDLPSSTGTGGSRDGILVTAEESDGLSTHSLVSFRKGMPVPRSAASVKTDAEGRFRIEGLSAGTYTLTESSPDALEQSVAPNLCVSPDRTVTVSKLSLTTMGRISGRITLDGSGTGNRGFFVFVEGTSYIAQTDDSGAFLIADASTGLVWKGTLASPPAAPLKNRAYHNSADGVSSVYDGNGADGGTIPGSAFHEAGASVNAAEQGSMRRDQRSAWKRYHGFQYGTRADSGILIQRPFRAGGSAMFPPVRKSS